MKSNLNYLTQAEYKEGSELVLINAKEHLQVSNSCIEQEFWGIGLSHLILACEEICKAAILRIKYNSPGLQIKELDSIFRNHNLKHERFLQILAAIWEFAETEKDTSSHKDNVVNSDGSIEINLDIRGITSLIIVILTHFSRQTKAVSWEQMRIRGFYVDRIGENWLVPNKAIASDELAQFSICMSLFFANVEEYLFKTFPTEGDYNLLLGKLGY